MLDKLKFVLANRKTAKLARAFHDEMTAMMVAFQLKAIREARGLTQQQAAEKIGITQEVVSRYENSANRQITVRMLQKFAECYDCALHVDFVSWRDWLKWIVEPFIPPRPFGENPGGKLTP